ncbi:MAG: hypothetical protein IPP51_07385 [Bacteroidetes bacterium]|nr:hypothetical protein [Bacteroidota bacterium]
MKNVTPITLHQTYILTSFDSGFFVIPPLPFLSREIKQPLTDTAYTEALLVGVKTIAIDTTREIKDIKATMDAPFPWMEYLPYFAIAWVVLMIVIFIIYKLSKRKKKALAAPVVPSRPAHELALEELKRIEAEKLWQNGFMKQYHSSVADTLRLYIERRFQINALEQTTDEIVKNFGHSLLGESEKNKLKYVLTLADTVKFAKAEPVLTENEQSIRYAYDFVNSTIPFEKPVEEKKEAGQ